VVYYFEQLHFIIIARPVFSCKMFTYFETNARLGFEKGNGIKPEFM